jgi:hypothetical protein
VVRPCRIPSTAALPAAHSTIQFSKEQHRPRFLTFLSIQAVEIIQWIVTLGDPTVQWHDARAQRATPSYLIHQPSISSGPVSSSVSVNSTGMVLPYGVMRTTQPVSQQSGLTSTHHADVAATSADLVPCRNVRGVFRISSFSQLDPSCQHRLIHGLFGVCRRVQREEAATHCSSGAIVLDDPRPHSPVGRHESPGIVTLYRRASLWTEKASRPDSMYFEAVRNPYAIAQQ